MKRMIVKLIERVRYARRTRTYDDPGPGRVGTGADRQPDADLAQRTPQNFANYVNGGS